MKKLLLILALALPLFLTAQNIETGVKAYESGDYKGAMAELDKVLSDVTKLKEKSLARAHYYRGMARLTYARKAHGNLEVTEMPLVRQLAIGAYEDLLGAKESDIDGKMAADIDSGNKRLVELLVELGRGANVIAQDPNRKADAKKEAYEDLLRFGTPITALDKFNYRGYLFCASGELGLGDSAAALKDFHLTDDWFFRSAPKDGDLMIAYTYIQLARLEWALNKDYTKANAVLEKGRKNLDAENKKIQTLGGHTPQQRAALEKKFHDVSLDLDRAFSDLKLAAGK